MTSRIGVAVNTVRKHCSNDEVVALAKILIKNWKKLLESSGPQESKKEKEKGKKLNIPAWKSEDDISVKLSKGSEINEKDRKSNKFITQSATPKSSSLVPKPERYNYFTEVHQMDGGEENSGDTEKLKSIKKTEVYQVDGGEENSGHMDEVYMMFSVIKSHKKNPWHVDFNGKSLVVEVNTGASLSIISDPTSVSLACGQMRQVPSLEQQKWCWVHIQ
ncbi:UNVERIFIED_CONTAM: hypothetical protein K2H54_053763 [Gekko kuhli]